MSTFQFQNDNPTLVVIDPTTVHYSQAAPAPLAREHTREDFLRDLRKIKKQPAGTERS